MDERERVVALIVAKTIEYKFESQNWLDPRKFVKSPPDPFRSRWPRVLRCNDQFDTFI